MCTANRLPDLRRVAQVRSQSYLAMQSIISLRYTTCHSEPFTMATRVLTNNSLTQHRSGNIPQTTSRVKLSTPGAQPKNAPDIRPTLDEVVDQILIRAKSPLAEEDVRKLAEILEKVSRKHLPVDQCIQPADGRYWSHATRSTCARGGDVSGGS